MSNRPRWGWAGWFGALLVIAAVLHAAGDGALSVPPTSAPLSQWSEWLQGTDPMIVAFALLRMAAIGLTWYAVAVTLVGAMARLAGAARVVACTDRLTLPLVRRAFAASLSMGLLASAAGIPGSTPVVAAEGTTTTTTAAGVPGAGQTAPPTIKMQRLPDAGATGSSGEASAPAEAETSRGAAQWRVEPGQCFWSIAEAVLSDAWGRAASDAEIVPYWRALIEANRSLLADHHNPDLIFPGQLFVIPPPASLSR